MKGDVLLKTFVEVANRKVMVEAAAHLNITPAAVSKHIKTLENELGIQLLKRSTRRVELTIEGSLYFEHAKQILEGYKKAEAALSMAKEEPSGLLKVISGPQFAYLHLIPHLKSFQKMYPKISLQIEMLQKLPDLEKEGIDVVVGLTDLPENCIQRTLMWGRWVMAASPDYLKDYGNPTKPSDLISHKIITRTQRTPNNVMTFEETAETVYFEPSLFFNDTRAMRRSALEGCGIVMLHDYIIEKDLREGKLVEILPKYMESKSKIPIKIAYLQTAHVHLKIRKFVDFIVEQIQN